jgi:hypothetical protein
VLLYALPANYALDVSGYVNINGYLVVNGINDRNNKNGKYNEQLSYNRAMEVANYLEERFGLSRDRFIVRYNLEGTGDADADRAVMFRNAQEGESGANNPPSPHPGLKAGQK